ncbi:Rv1355c family protein [Mycobacterium marinum]|uniref:Rv1355c family protein n=1 Tax=Mycobacterium marinum TaxID=1781 RepID=UPI003564BFAC
MNHDDHENDSCAIVLDESDAAERLSLARLRTDPKIEVIDRWEDQVAGAQRLLPPLPQEVLAEPKRWAYYPWRRAVISIPGPSMFRALRLDRNRNLITSDEQRQLGKLQIGVVGLSVGHYIAHLLAAEGLCGELRLVDFDNLELSNLNRVPATVFDVGLNKATLAARRIAELDPYLPVEVLASGLTPATMDEFLDGLDIVVEECDSLDMKVRVREAARARGVPVLMATSDRGLIDVERFDLDPSRPILHGLLGELDVTGLAGLSNRDKVPYVLRILDGPRLSTRSAASLVEIDQTLSTWPQLAGEVALGATAVAEAVRRIGLGEPLRSGRVRIDVGEALDRLADPDPTAEEFRPGADGVETMVSDSEICALVAAAAGRAPSAANNQPWQIEAGPDSVSIRLDPEQIATLDVDFRASAVAVGAAWFNARVAAAKHGMLGSAELIERDGTSPLCAVVRLEEGGDPNLARLYESMLARETNRHLGASDTLEDDIAASLEAIAASEGARLQLVTANDDIEKISAIFAATDRIRYLTPHMHAEMLSELRWPAGDCMETGIDIRSLEMDRGELAGFQIARRPDVVTRLASWGAGAALGDYTRDRVRASAGLGMVSIQGSALNDYARGGSAMEAVWIAAQHLGLAVQPVAPVFLYARNDDELRRLTPEFAAPLGHLQRTFHALTHTRADEAHVVMLRFSHAPATTVRSLRRSRFACQLTSEN